MGLIERLRRDRAIPAHDPPLPDGLAADSAGRALTAPLPAIARNSSALAPVLQQLEDDVLLTMRVITYAAANTQDRVDESVATVGQIRKASDDLSGLSAAARVAAADLIQTTERLTSSTHSIERQIAGADNFILSARELTGTVGASTDRLAAEVERISGVVALVGNIARKTNLLALNAGLEAVRAGESATSLAIIASEIKSLAEQVQKVTTDISRQVSGLQLVARHNAHEIAKISALVRRIDPVITAVKKSVKDQIRETGAVSGSAAASAEFAGKVSTETARVHELTVDALDASNRAGRAGVNMTSLLERLSQRSVVFLRQVSATDRRKHDRVPAKIPCTIEVAGQSRQIIALDISIGGTLLMANGLEMRPGTMARLVMENLGVIPITILAKSELGYHTRFDQVSDDLIGRIKRLSAQVHVENQPIIDLAQQIAQEITSAFAYGVKYDEVKREYLFSADYRPIDGTDPVQYISPALPFYEKVLPTILARGRASLLKPIFVVALDRNSYLPVHHPEFSLRQKRDDPDWNDQNARNRRILERSQSLVGARNKDRYNLRVYPRQLRDGTSVPVLNVGAPIFLETQFWGNVQVGLEM